MEAGEPGVTGQGWHGYRTRAVPSDAGFTLQHHHNPPTHTYTPPWVTLTQIRTPRRRTGFDPGSSRVGRSDTRSPVWSPSSWHLIMFWRERRTRVPLHPPCRDHAMLRAYTRERRVVNTHPSTTEQTTTVRTVEEPVNTYPGTSDRSRHDHVRVMTIHTNITSSFGYETGTPDNRRVEEVCTYTGDIRLRIRYFRRDSAGPHTTWRVATGGPASTSNRGVVSGARFHVNSPRCPRRATTLTPTSAGRGGFTSSNTRRHQGIATGGPSSITQWHRGSVPGELSSYPHRT